MWNTVGEIIGVVLMAAIMAGAVTCWILWAIVTELIMLPLSLCVWLKTGKWPAPFWS